MTARSQKMIKEVGAVMRVVLFLLLTWSLASACFIGVGWLMWTR